MFTSLEKKLVAKDYIDKKDTSYILSYCKKSDPLMHIDIGYYPFKPTEKYKFTFPISNGYHYTTYFNNDKKLCKYANLIITTYIK